MTNENAERARRSVARKLSSDVFGIFVRSLTGSSVQLGTTNGGLHDEK